MEVTLGAMNLLPVLLLLQTAPATPAAKTDVVVVRVPSTHLHLRVEIPGFENDKRTTDIMRKSLGDKALLFGSIKSLGTNITCIIEPEGEVHLTSAQRREKALAHDESKPTFFEVGDVACSEARWMVERISGLHALHAFVVAGGYAFDLSFSASIEPGRPDKLTREYFEQVVRSIRFALVRRGTWDDLPGEVIDLMSETAFCLPTWIDCMEHRTKERADDWAVHFVMAEMLKHVGAPEKAQAEAYARAITLLEVRKDPPRLERFVRVLAEDGLGLALADMDKVAESIPHFRKGYDVASELDVPARAGLAYNLACSYARVADGEKAVEFLKKAVAVDGSYLKRATEDRDFAKVREDKTFQDLLRGDAGGK